MSKGCKQTRALGSARAHTCWPRWRVGGAGETHTWLALESATILHAGQLMRSARSLARSAGRRDARDQCAPAAAAAAPQLAHKLQLLSAAHQARISSRPRSGATRELANLQRPRRARSALCRLRRLGAGGATLAQAHFHYHCSRRRSSVCLCLPFCFFCGNKLAAARMSLRAPARATRKHTNVPVERRLQTALSTAAAAAAFVARKSTRKESDSFALANAREVCPLLVFFSLEPKAACLSLRRSDRPTDRLCVCVSVRVFGHSNLRAL